MIYLLHGQNFVGASKKIQEIKKIFLKTNSNFLLEEMDGDDFISPQDFFGLIQNQSLFSQKRLFVFKNIFSKIQNAEKFLLNIMDFLKESKDIFLFWEPSLNDDKILKIFQKNAEKIQQLKEENPVLAFSPLNSVFKFVDKIFVSSGINSLLHLDGAKVSGVDARSLVNVIFWKLKKASKKDKRILNIAYETILADLNLKINNRDWEENLSRLAIEVASRDQI